MINDDLTSIENMLSLLIQEDDRLEQENLRQTISIPSTSPASPLLALNVNHNPSR